MKVEEAFVIRVDADTRIGTGHLMRCLALAEAVQLAGGKVTFVKTNEASALESRLKKEGMDIVHTTTKPGSYGDATQTVDIARQAGARWVVVDGYHFSAEYQETIKKSGLKMLFLDDYGHAEHYFADFVLNQNCYANQSLYLKREHFTKLLLGPRYILLRQAFAHWRSWQKNISDLPRNVLLTLGGGDVNNVAAQVVRALPQTEIDNLELIIVVGAVYPYYTELSAIISELPLKICLQRNVTNMPELMAWADVAITAGGTTSWELIFMGVPSLVLSLAENQRPVVEWLAKEELAIQINIEKLSGDLRRGVTQLSSPKVRAQMSSKGRNLVDGRGCDRVLRHLKMTSVQLRPVISDDCRLLWEWTNDPDTRTASFSSKPIPWAEHVKWFEQKTRDPNYIMYLALNDDNVPIGQVRFTVEDSEATVSVSIGSEFRNQGYGCTIISLASSRLFREIPVTTIHAYVKSTNQASLRAFLKAGFEQVQKRNIHGFPAEHFILRSVQ